MDLGHLKFCRPGNPFYDKTGPEDDSPAHAEFAPDVAPEGWKRESGTEWTHLTPVDNTLPLQGWKIHVSATTDNADRILAEVLDYCLARRISFKFLRSMAELGRRNSKYGDRSASGKFVAIYPADESQLEVILAELGERLDGEKGPYILSDLRWRSGPLYVRYGGFASRMMRSESGELVYCIEDPDGNLVEDRRGPGFRPPPWAKIPECLAEALAARQAGTLKDFPFKVSAALHFSNGGGVYRATDTRTGAEVLLKEARPYAGIDEQGRDAVQRQETECWALETLAGLPAIPAMVERRIGYEHYFLARAFAPGEPLQRLASARNPYVTGVTDPAALAGYTEWALRILDRIDDSVQQMHDRGVVYGDLHPGNILVDDDDKVSFIDLETASPLAERASQAIGAPGFRAPVHYRGVDTDRFAMGCLRLAMFVPLTVILLTDPRKLAELLDLVTSTFPVPAGFADQVRRDLGPDPYGSPPAVTVPLTASENVAVDPSVAADPILPELVADQWQELRERLAITILEGATPQREDRLYPGDIGQFLLPAGGISLAFGAAGVITVLNDLGIEVPAAHVEWMIQATRRLDHPAPGLFDGLAGVAYALDRLGDVERADQVLAAIRALPSSLHDDTLTSGLPGVALLYGQLAVSRGDRDLQQACLAAVEQLRERPLPEGGSVGLLRGASGRALAYLAAYRLTSDRDLLESAAQAVRHDLRQAGWEPGQMRPAEAAARRELHWLVPTLQSGGGGIPLAVAPLLRLYDAPDLAQFQEVMATGVGQEYFPAVGLFQGRVGAMLVLHRLGTPGDDPVLRRHLRGLRLVALPLGRHGLGFLGDGLLRLSFDLASGSAGVLAVVDRILTDQADPLPLHLLGCDLLGDR